MKMNKLLMSGIAAVTALFLVACDEDLPTRESSPAAPEGGNVYFPEQDSAKSNRTLVLGIEAESFEVQIARRSDEAPLTVKLKTTGKDASRFSVPETVSFAAGEDTITFEVTIGDIEPLQVYSAEIMVDDVNNNPYYKYPMTAWSIQKEDFAPYSVGIYTDPFYWEGAWEQVLEYSPSTELYRFKGLFDEGGDENFLFEWDGAEKITIHKGTGPNLDDYLAPYNSGLYLDGEGSYVYGFYVNDQNILGGGQALTYDEATKTFTFPIFWGLADGRGYGWFASTYEITEVY